MTIGKCFMEQNCRVLFAALVVDHQNRRDDKIDQTWQRRQSQVSRLSIRCGDSDQSLLYAKPVIHHHHHRLQQLLSIFD